MYVTKHKISDLLVIASDKKKKKANITKHHKDMPRDEDIPKVEAELHK